MSTEASTGTNIGVPIGNAEAMPDTRQSARNTDREGAYPNIIAFLRALFGKHWQWLAIGAIYLLGWYTPFTDGSAGDGPMRWCWETWSTLRYSMGFQPWVLLAVAVVLWAQREDIYYFWRTRVAGRFSEASPRRRGNLIPLAIGCFLLITSHMVQVKGVGVLAMILIAYGIAYRMYGPLMLRGPLLWPLALLWLMMPPPDHVTDLICNTGVNHVMVKISAAVLSLCHIHTVAAGSQLALRGYSVEINPLVCAGTNVVFATWLVVLVYQMCRRADATMVLLSLIVSALVSVCFQIVRNIVAALIYPNFPEQTDWLIHSIVPPCVQIVAAFFATIFLMRLKAPAVSGAHAPHVPHAVLRSVRVAGKGLDQAAAVPLTGLGAGFKVLGRLWTRSERGLENMLKALTPKKKRRSSRSGRSSGRR